MTESSKLHDFALATMGFFYATLFSSWLAYVARESMQMETSGYVANYFCDDGSKHF